MPVLFHVEKSIEVDAIENPLGLYIFFGFNKSDIQLFSICDDVSNADILGVEIVGYIATHSQNDEF